MAQIFDVINTVTNNLIKQFFPLGFPGFPVIGNISIQRETNDRGVDPTAPDKEAPPPQEEKEEEEDYYYYEEEDEEEEEDSNEGGEEFPFPNPLDFLPPLPFMKRNDKITSTIISSTTSPQSDEVEIF